MIVLNLDHTAALKLKTKVHDNTGTVHTCVQYIKCQNEAKPKNFILVMAMASELNIVSIICVLIQF